MPCEQCGRAHHEAFDDAECLSKRLEHVEKERDAALLQIEDLKKKAEKLGRAPMWFLHADTCDRKALEEFMEQYCLWYNNVTAPEKRKCEHSWVPNDLTDTHCDWCGENR